jgi:hypothetical protein
MTVPCPSTPATERTATRPTRPAAVPLPRQGGAPPVLPAPAPRSGGAFAVIGLLGGVLVLAGSVLPWLTITAPVVGTLTRSGLDAGGDGILTLLLGVAAAGIGIARLATRVHPLVQRVPVVLGAGVLAVTVLDLSRVGAALEAIGSASPVHPSAGPGLYLLVVGSVVTAAGGFGLTWRD